MYLADILDNKVSVILTNIDKSQITSILFYK